MFRLLLIFSLIVALPQPANVEPHGDQHRGTTAGPAVGPPRRESDLARQVADAVRARFAAAAAAAPCRRTDNLFGYDLLLSKIPAPQRPAVTAAAHEGTQKGVIQPPPSCSVALQSLQSADDALMVLSERVARDPAFATR